MNLDEELCPLDVEVQSLKAIFSDELEVNRSEKDGKGIESLVVCMSPESTKDDNPHFVRFEIVFEIPSDYPQVMPKMSFKNVRGLSEEAQNRTETNMKNRAQELTGSAMLFELIQVAKEQLTSGTAPSVPCSICLFGFAVEDQFQRTPCFHFFHSHCLASHVKFTLAQEENLSEKLRLGDNSKEETQDVLCPVCRLPIPFEHCEPDQFPVPKESLDSEGNFEVTPELRRLQGEMASLYSQQKAKGSIIDLEAEKNKFFIEISNTPDMTPVPCSPNSNSPAKKSTETTTSSLAAKNLEKVPERLRKHLDPAFRIPKSPKQEDSVSNNPSGPSKTKQDADPSDTPDVEGAGVAEKDPTPVIDWSQESEAVQKPYKRRNKKGPRKAIPNAVEDDEQPNKEQDQGLDSERSESLETENPKISGNKLEKYNPSQKDRYPRKNVHGETREEMDGSRDDNAPDKEGTVDETKYRGGGRYKRPYFIDKPKYRRRNENRENSGELDESNKEIDNTKDEEKDETEIKSRDTGHYRKQFHGARRNERYPRRNEVEKETEDGELGEDAGAETKSQDNRYRKSFNNEKRKDRYQTKTDKPVETGVECIRDNDDADINNETEHTEESQSAVANKKPYYRKNRKPRNFDDDRERFHHAEGDSSATNDQEQVKENLNNYRNYVNKPRFKKNFPRYAERGNTHRRFHENVGRYSDNRDNEEQAEGQTKGPDENTSSEKFTSDHSSSRNHGGYDRPQNQSGYTRFPGNHRYNRRNNWPRYSSNRFQSRNPRAPNDSCTTATEIPLDADSVSNPKNEDQGDDSQETQIRNDSTSKSEDMPDTQTSVELPINTQHPKYQKHDNRYKNRNNRNQYPSRSEPNASYADNKPDFNSRENVRDSARNGYSLNSDSAPRGRPYQQRFHREYDTSFQQAPRYDNRYSDRHEKPRNWQYRPYNNNNYNRYSHASHGSDSFGGANNDSQTSRDNAEEASLANPNQIKPKLSQNSAHNQNSYSGDWSEPISENRNIQTTTSSYDSPRDQRKSSGFQRTRSQDCEAPDSRSEHKSQSNQNRYNRSDYDRYSKQRFQTNYRERAASSPVSSAPEVPASETIPDSLKKDILPFTNNSCIPAPFSKSKRSNTDP